MWVVLNELSQAEIYAHTISQFFHFSEQYSENDLFKM